LGLYEPAPPLQVPPAALPPTEPASVTVAMAHIDWSGPALTVAAGLNVTTIASLTAGQGPPGSLDVMVKVTDPELLSDALGVYVVLRADAFAKVPVPDVDQVEEVAAPLRVPVTDTVVTEEQTL
jgi:hypothetical protein